MTRTVTECKQFHAGAKSCKHSTMKATQLGMIHPLQWTPCMLPKDWKDLNYRVKSGKKKHCSACHAHNDTRILTQQINERRKYKRKHILDCARLVQFIPGKSGKKSYQTRKLIGTQNIWVASRGVEIAILEELWEYGGKQNAWDCKSIYRMEKIIFGECKRTCKKMLEKRGWKHVHRMWRDNMRVTSVGVER